MVPMETTSEYVNKTKSEFSLGFLKEQFAKTSGLNVLVIGDTILDQYVFVTPKGRAVKDPILSVGYLKEETYAGGVLAVVNHLSGFVKSVKAVTLVGDQNNFIEFIEKAVGSNVQLKTFTKKNSPMTVKQRFVDVKHNHKMFKVEYMNEEPVSKELSDEIVRYLEQELPKYDLVLVTDFGHGFINEAIRRTLEKHAKFLAINVQVNSANMGFNYFNQYDRFDFISMDEFELRMPMGMRFEPFEEVARKAQERYFKNNPFLITRSNKGATLFRGNSAFDAPALAGSVKDTVGAGDAVFAIASLLVLEKAPDKLIPFMANCAGGVKVKYLGNKESVTREKLLDFAGSVYENGMG